MKFEGKTTHVVSRSSAGSLNLGLFFAQWKTVITSDRCPMHYNKCTMLRTRSTKMNLNNLPLTLKELYIFVSSSLFIRTYV